MSKISIGEISKLGIGFALGYLTYKLISFLPESTSQESQPHKSQTCPEIATQ